MMKNNKNKIIYKIKGELKSVYADSAPSLSNVKYQTAQFKCSRRRIFVEERPGRAIELTASKMIE